MSNALVEAVQSNMIRSFSPPDPMQQATASYIMDSAKTKKLEVSALKRAEMNEIRKELKEAKEDGESSDVIEILVDMLKSIKDM